MDTVTRFEPRRVDQAESANALQPDPRQRLAVTVTYLLSEEGRKASLLAGGNGRALQEVTIQVPANRLHLVTVDANGRAHLKLRPRFELNAEQRVVKIDALPAYDVAADRGRSLSRRRAQSSARARVSRRTECRTPCPDARPTSSAAKKSPALSWQTRHSAPCAARRPRLSGASSTHRTVECSSMSGRITAPRVSCRPRPTADGGPTFARATNGASARRRRKSPHTLTRSRSSPTGSRSTVRRSSRRATPPGCSRLRRSSRR